MPYCSECGTRLPEDEEATFCPSCGAPVQAPSRTIGPVEVSRIRRIETSRRIESVAAAFIICLVATSFGAVLPIDPSEAQGISQEFEEIEDLISSPFSMAVIYGNNLMHCLAMFTPVVGPFYGLYVLFSTGRVLAALASIQGTSPALLLAFTFILPHAWIEYASYALALSESFWLALTISRHQLRGELANLFKMISACALLLLSAALIETYLISSLA